MQRFTQALWHGAEVYPGLTAGASKRALSQASVSGCSFLKQKLHHIILLLKKKKKKEKTFTVPSLPAELNPNSLVRFIKISPSFNVSPAVITRNTFTIDS